MVRNPVSERSDGFQVVIEPLPQLSNAFCRIKLWQHADQVAIPNTVVVPAGKHSLPENEPELWYDLASRMCASAGIE
ncbi:hypothetical protein [Chromohalobacter sp. 11-W]|uniref:hypothetical protein n=1 Tax=Chromohalobacter sp. 11-W TaxID=2994061 RepID=UPI0024682C1C|nr:hypothetical protein [Chromohalobacter sp. 11-W]